MVLKNILVVIASTGKIVDELIPLIREFLSQAVDLTQGELSIFLVTQYDDKELRTLYSKLGDDADRIQHHNVETRMGYLSKFNVALEQYEGVDPDLYIFTNDDVTINPSFLSEILVCPKETPILYAPMVKDSSGSVQLSVYRKNYTKMGMFWRIYDEGMYTRLSSKLGVDLKKASSGMNKERYTVYGCCFIMNALSMRDLNKFDDKIFLYYEEAYFSKMVKLFKWECKVLENTDIIHAGGGTMTKRYNIGRSRIDMNTAMYVAKKYMGFNTLELTALKVFKIFELVIRQLVEKIRTILQNG